MLGRIDRRFAYLDLGRRLTGCRRTRPLHHLRGRRGRRQDDPARAGSARGSRAAGIDVVRTREPGGTPGAEAIRGSWSRARRALVAAHRALLFAGRPGRPSGRLIEPALARGSWVVLCDRFIDSTRVYQGLAGGLGHRAGRLAARDVLGGRLPDLTVLLDLPVAVGLGAPADARAMAAASRPRGGDFHERVRAGFLALAAARAGALCRHRCRRDASRREESQDVGRHRAGRVLSGAARPTGSALTADAVSEPLEPRPTRSWSARRRPRRCAAGLAAAGCRMPGC